MAEGRLLMEHSKMQVPIQDLVQLSVIWEPKNCMCKSSA